MRRYRILAASLIAGISIMSSASASVVPVVGADLGGADFGALPVGVVTTPFTIGDWTFTPVNNTQIKIGTDSNGAQPFGTSGNYLSILGIGGAGVVDVTFTAPRTSIGFFWGSVDDFNSIKFFNAA